MLNILFKGYLASMAVKVLNNYRHLSIQFLKIETAKSYLQGVRMARRSALALMKMGFLIGLIFTGVLLFHGALFLMLPWSLHVKAVLGMLLGCVYVMTGFIALYLAFDEKTWITQSGAEALLKEVTKQVKTE